MTAKREKTFEENLKRLEEIVTTLEEGKTSLEDSIELFEEGIELSKLCGNKLNGIENRISVLIQDGEEMKKEKFFVDGVNKDEF